MARRKMWSQIVYERDQLFGIGFKFRIVFVNCIEVGLMTGITEGVIPEQFNDVIKLGVNVCEEFFDGFMCHNYEVVKRSL